MCGRFSLVITTIMSLAERFRAEAASFDWRPRYNVAPAQVMPVVIHQEEAKKIVPMKWGLVPSWSKEGKTRLSMINARAETLFEKPSFKTLIRTRRCIIPADGFYEWKKGGEEKIPFRITRKDDALFGFAGLWDEWQRGGEPPLHTFTIVTTKANELLSSIHDRMPVMLLPENEEAWLKSDRQSGEIIPLMTPYPSSEMKMTRVSKSVNSWKNDQKECIEPLDHFSE